MLTELPLLSLVIWIPIIGGLVVLAVGDHEPWGPRTMALLFSLLTLGLSIPLYTGFDTQTAGMQFVELANVNHVFKEVEGVANPAMDYTDPAKPFSREAGRVITEFIKATLLP